MSNAKPVPEGMHTVTPHLVVRGAAKAIDFYKQAFGAEELGRSATPDGRIMHAAIRVGDSVIFLADEFTEMGGPKAPEPGKSPVTLHLYLSDVDASFDRAVRAGANVKTPVADMFWGDRYGQVTDPFGHTWSLATHKEDLSREEADRRGREFFAKAG